MDAIYCITCVFNPRRFESRNQLYREFARWVSDSGVKLLTVEIAFGERPHCLTTEGNPWHLMLRTKHEIWHKERALNLGLWRLALLVPNFKYVAWMDCDIRLTRTDWSTEIVHLLQHYAVVQMFGESRSLSPTYQTIYHASSIAANYEKYGKVDWYNHPGIIGADPGVKAGHPGLAWAFRRDELNDIGGWLDICVNGSGDLHMVGCYAGQWQLAGIDSAPPGYQAAIKQYGWLCDRAIHGNMSFMSGTCDHYWHGRAGDRGYEDRGSLIRKYQFNPTTDLLSDVQGLWKWNLADPRVRAMAIEVRKSLGARNEDTIEMGASSGSTSSTR